MPQPVHFSQHIPFHFTPLALLKRPVLASYMTAIAMQWTEIQARIATLLVALLEGEAKTGIAMYFAITSDGGKRAVIDTICDLKLEKAQKEEFQRILRKVGEREVERNRIVHGAWGISPKYPDDLLWSDLRDAIALHTDLLALTTEQDRQRRRIAYQKSLQVWTEQDFIDVFERIGLAWNELHVFTTPIIQKAFGRGSRSVPPEEVPRILEREHPAPSGKRSGPKFP